MTSSSSATDLSSIQGLGSTTIRKMNEAGIFSIEELANEIPEFLEGDLNCSLQAANAFIIAAQRHVELRSRKKLVEQKIREQEELIEYHKEHLRRHGWVFDENGKPYQQEVILERKLIQPYLDLPADKQPKSLIFKTKGNRVVEVLPDFETEGGVRAA